MLIRPSGEEHRADHVQVVDLMRMTEWSGASSVLQDSVGECAFGDFCHGSRCQVEKSEVRDAGGAERGAVQPGIGADEVDGGGGQDAGEMGLGLAAVGVRRSRVRRMAWEMVPSTPARMS
jgi:hypothetical protein